MRGWRAAGPGVEGRWVGTWAGQRQGPPPFYQHRPGVQDGQGTWKLPSTTYDGNHAGYNLEVVSNTVLFRDEAKDKIWQGQARRVGVMFEHKRT